MRTIEEHLAAIGALLAPVGAALETETLEVSGAALSEAPWQAMHRVLGEDLPAPTSLPAFDNSQMDGYAVIAAELATATPEAPIRLRIAARVAAGDGVARHESGTATPIMTGAAIPSGADAVVPIEQAIPSAFPVWVGRAGVRGEADRAETGHEVEFAGSVEPGTFVRAAGSDVAAGDVLLPAGTRLGPAQLGVVAGTGATAVWVRRRIRVLLVSTGHEIRDAGTELVPGQIFDANSVALTSALTAIGCDVVCRPCRSDDAADLLALLRDELAPEAGPVPDVVVTVGGVSAGAREVVRDALGPRGVEFVKVAMQPGGPQGFGLAAIETAADEVSASSAGPAFDEAIETGDGAAVRVPVVCLPGNPVSALVSFEAFVRPALLAAAGDADPERERRRGRAAHAFESIEGRHQLRRGTVDDDGALTLVGGPSSHLLHSYAGSTVLVHVPVGVSAVAAGDPLDYWRIDG